MPEIARSECPAYRNPRVSTSSCTDRFVVPVTTDPARQPQIPPKKTSRWAAFRFGNMIAPVALVLG
jgi:hypothetical protein